MDIQGIFNSAVAYLRATPIVAAIITLFILIFIVRKTKLFFIILSFAALLITIIYLIMQVAAPATSIKEKLIQKEEIQIEKQNK